MIVSSCPQVIPDPSGDAPQKVSPQDPPVVKPPQPDPAAPAGTKPAPVEIPAKAFAPVGEIGNYDVISRLVLVALALCCLGLTVAYSPLGRLAVDFFGAKAAFGFQLFLWGAMGASISCSLFLAKDKDDTEVESLKKTPDPARLRYPTRIDVVLYAHRIFTSACLGVVGAVFLFAGLSYFEVQPNTFTTKQRAFFILFSFLIGMYQGNFVDFLGQRFQKILQRSADTTGKGKASGNGGGGAA